MKTEIFEIKTNGSEKTIENLRKEVESLKGQLSQLTKGTEEYSKVAGELGNKTSVVDGALKKVGSSATSAVSSLNGIKEAVGSVSGSFNLLGQASGGLTGILEQSLNSLQSLTKAGPGVSGAFKSIGASMKALIANPVGATIAAIVVAFKALTAIVDKVKESINRNEVAQQNLQKAMVPVKGIINGITAAFDAMVETMTKVVAGIGNVAGKVLDFLHIGNEARKLEKEAVEAEQKLTADRRKNLEETSKLEAEAAELREKAADKESYTAEERLKFQQEARKKEERIAAIKKKEAEDELALLEKRAAQGVNDKKANDELAAARAKLNNVSTEYEKTLRRLNKEEAALTKEISAEAEATRKEAAARAQAYADAKKSARKEYKDLLEDIRVGSLIGLDKALDANQKAYDADVAKLNDSLKKRYITQEEYTAALEKLRARQLEADNQATNNWLKQQQQIRDEIAEIGMTETEAKISSIVKSYEQGRQKMEEALAAGLISQEEFDNYIERSRKAQEDAVTAMKDEITKGELAKAIEEAINPEDFVGTLQSKIETAFAEGKIDESKTRKLLAQIGLDEATIDAALTRIKQQIKKAKLAEGLSGATAVATQLGDVLGSLSDIFAESEEAQKAFSIASIINQTAVGVITALSGVFTTKSGPWDIALAAAQAVSIAVAGAAQLHNVLSKKIDGSSNIPDTPSVSTTAVQTSNYQGGGDYQVYVTETDISETQKKVKTIETNAKY